MPDLGRDLGATLPVLAAHAEGVDGPRPGWPRRSSAGWRTWRGELSTDLALPFAIELLAPPSACRGRRSWFAARTWRCSAARRRPGAEQAGRRAMAELAEYFRPLVDGAAGRPGPDMVSAIAGLDSPTEPAAPRTSWRRCSRPTTRRCPAPGQPVVPAAHPSGPARGRGRGAAAGEDRLPRGAAPLHAGAVAPRFTRHEVERFGRLLPEGALVMCSAAAANRDPQCVRRPGGVHRATPRPLPARATWPVPRRRAVLGDRLRARQAVDPPRRA